MAENDRPRGLLSPADRAYLRGEADLGSVQSERNARARIRDRVYQGLLDFELLVTRLETRDRELIVESRTARTDGTALFDGMASTVAFLYLAAEDAGLAFDTLLQEGINVAEVDRDRAASVQLDLTFHRLSVDRLQDRLAAGESLSLTELAYLRQSDAIRDDELVRYLEESETTARIEDDRIQSRVTDF